MKCSYLCLYASGIRKSRFAIARKPSSATERILFIILEAFTIVDLYPTILYTYLYSFVVLFCDIFVFKVRLHVFAHRRRIGKEFSATGKGKFFTRAVRGVNISSCDVSFSHFPTNAARICVHCFVLCSLFVCAFDLDMHYA